MAYTSAKADSLSIPRNPAVLKIRVARGTAANNYPVKIPWDRCRLTYSYAVTTTVVATADMTITLKLDSSTGDTMHTITVPTAASAIGDVTEGTVTTAAACRSLSRSNTGRDVVNVNVALHASGGGGADVYMYFESDT